MGSREFSETPEGIASDIQDIESIDIVRDLLQAICDMTGMGFAAIARVTDDSWTAMAVLDQIEFGLQPGSQIELESTFCKGVRETGIPVVFSDRPRDPVYSSNSIAKRFGIESYFSVPILMSDGDCFGTLCAIDRRPAPVDLGKLMSQFRLFARLVAVQLENNRRRIEAEAAATRAIEAGEMREQFIAILGHDLRNPLQGIQAGVQLMQRRAADDPDMTRIAQRVNNSVKRMSTLINDVLDFARGKLGGDFGVELTVVDDLGDAFRTVVNELVDAHPEHRVESNILVDRPVLCDRARLQQLASNLLGNAMTHGSAISPIAFTVTTSASELVLRVANDGDPIEPESLNRVFAPFWRSSGSKKREGLGLGLYICAQVVKGHHGAIDVTSSSSGRTAFIARIPVGLTSS